MNLNFAIQVFGDPFLNEFRRQPERPKREVDIFNGQRFRQNRFQRLHIGGQAMRFRFGDFRFDVTGKIAAFEFNSCLLYTSETILLNHSGL